MNVLSTKDTPLSAQGAITMPDVDSSLRGRRYVVCVTDTLNSWSAFQVSASFD